MFDVIDCYAITAIVAGVLLFGVLCLYLVLPDKLE